LDAIKLWLITARPGRVVSTNFSRLQHLDRWLVTGINASAETRDGKSLTLVLHPTILSLLLPLSTLHFKHLEINFKAISVNRAILKKILLYYILIIQNIYSVIINAKQSFDVFILNLYK
jgi:hypothetical protein